MAKKRLVEREIRRKITFRKYNAVRSRFKDKLAKRVCLDNYLKVHFDLQELPRDSAYVRMRNRCLISGRPLGYYRDFGLSRHFLREMAYKGFLPGITKSSW